MRILVMGGTRFDGPSWVHERLGCGHTVTICNRGHSAADPPPPSTECVAADRTAWSCEGRLLDLVGSDA